MVCMDGFILTHAVERVDVPDAGAGRRVPAAVRAAPGARPRRAGDDRRDGRARRRSPRSATSCTPSRCRRSTRSRAIAADFADAFGRDSGGLRARLPRRGRRDRRRRARLGARHDRGRRRRAARARASAIGALGAQVLPPVPARRGPRRARPARSAWSCSRRRSPSAPAASSARTCGSRCRACRSAVYDVVAGLGGRPITRRRCAACSPTRVAGPARAADVPRPRPRARRARARARRPPPAGPARREHAARLGIVAGGRSDARPADQVLPGRARSRSATACSTRSSARCRPTRARSNTLTSGHRACQGCGEALGARYALDAAMRATRRPADRRQRDRLPRGLLHAVSRELVAAAVDPLAVRQRAGRRHRRRRRAEGQGPRRRPRDRPGRRRRHGRHRLRLPVGHVRAQRRRAVRLLRQRGAT